MQKEEIILYIEKKYKVKPQFPWAPKAEHMVFKHSKNKKWFALIMGVTGNKLGLETGDIVEVINLKCDTDLSANIRMSKGILPAYHMNKKHWISVILDERVADDTVKSLIDLSFELTAVKK